MLFPWLHVAALIAYLGSVIGLVWILFPCLAAIRDHKGQVELLARSLRLYNPVQIGALGLVVLTGALQLTELKATYREILLKEVWLTLGLKLVLSFLLITLSVYQSMGVAHRFVRRYEGGEAPSPQELQSLVRRLRALGFSILLLAAPTLWLGVRMRG